MIGVRFVRLGFCFGAAVFCRFDFRLFRRRIGCSVV